MLLLGRKEERQHTLDLRTSVLCAMFAPRADISTSILENDLDKICVDFLAAIGFASFVSVVRALYCCLTKSRPADIPEQAIAESQDLAIRSFATCPARLRAAANFPFFGSMAGASWNATLWQYFMLAYNIHLDLALFMQKMK